MSGANNKLVGQIGEHLISAKLGTLGFYASPYSGNVPGFDITAIHAETLRVHLVQVKASSGGALFHTEIDKWCEWSIDMNNKQHIGDLHSLDDGSMIWVFVCIPNRDLIRAEYYILSKFDVQRKVVERYRNWISSHGFIRPRGGSSKHAIINVDDVSEYKDNFKLFEK